MKIINTKKEMISATIELGVEELKIISIAIGKISQPILYTAWAERGYGEKHPQDDVTTNLYHFFNNLINQKGD